MHCLYSLERRLKAKPDLSNMYHEFMTEYMQLGHMSECEDPDLLTVGYNIPITVFCVKAAQPPNFELYLMQVAQLHQEFHVMTFRWLDQLFKMICCLFYCVFGSIDAFCRQMSKRCIDRSLFTHLTDICSMYSGVIVMMNLLRNLF